MDEKELLKVIDQTVRDRVASLDLSDKELTVLPPEIRRLTHLKRFHLGGHSTSNRLVTLPAEIGQLINLERLAIGGNQLHTLPPEIGKLKNLVFLNLGGNQLTNLPRELWQLTNLTELVLAGNQFAVVPPEIGQLINLKRLNFGGFAAGNQLTTLPREIGQLKNLTILELGGNQLTALPQEIGQLKNLVTFDLGGNQLTTLPQEIGQLTNLSYLNLSGNKLAKLPPEIGELRNLTELILGGFDAGNQLTFLPSEIGQLTKLIELRLGGNQLTNLPEEIWQLERLVHLDLGGNQLARLSAGIGQLSNLKVLNLSGNRLITLPSEIGQLTKLQELNLSGNQLAVLPPEIGQLTNLESLELGGLPGGNQIMRLPDEIGKLTQLIRLDLSSNQLTSLPPEISSLANLKKLDLRGNHLTSLPEEIVSLTNLSWLDLDGNQLSLPPEILGLKNEPQQLIRAYIQHKADSATKHLNEAKLLIVGQAEVGKTSLVRRLVERRYNSNEPKTEGIDIRKWLLHVNGREIRLNIWDFGGQEILHATHQFFLTKRSLYLLVLDARKGEQDSKLEYWLKIIQSFGGDSPIIVIINKIDEHPLELDQRGLQAKYPTIKTFVSTSCKNDTGIAKLEEIIKAEVNRLEHITTEWSPASFTIKTQLEEMHDDFIPYSRYISMCQDVGIIDEVGQRALIRYLHDLGIVLNFQDDPRLEDTNILNPKWVTNGVYQILNSNELFQSKGILEREMLGQILDSRAYPKNKHLFIIDMMRKFELCFDFEGLIDKKFLIPGLLTKEEPYTGDWLDALTFQYHYKVLLDSVISRFIVRMHSFIHQNTYWRNGVVLFHEENEAKALIKADQEDKKIYIWISGPEHSRRTFLAIIRSHFEHIHKTIPKLEAKEKVPLPKYPEIVVDYNHLLTLERLGKDTFIPEGLTEEINVKQLLDGVETEQSRKNRRDNRGKERRVDHQPDQSPSQYGKTNPWRSGSFYLVTLVIILALLAVIGTYVSWYALPIVIVGALLAIAIVGALQLRQDKGLSEANFLDLMIETYKRMPLLKRDDSEREASDITVNKEREVTKDK